MDSYAISSDKKIFFMSELNKLGYSAYMVRNMVARGQLVKLHNSTYENTGYEGEDSDFIYAYAYVPDGVICLLSAAAHYGLCRKKPESIDVAVEQKRNISTLPIRPRIKLRYFEEARLETGVAQIEVCNQRVKIYDVEKTVADIIGYRNRLGIEETEVLANYLKRPDKDINKLCWYAEKLRCMRAMDRYLDRLL